VGDAVPADVTAAGALYRVFDDESLTDSRARGRGSSGSEYAARSGEDARVRELGYAINRDAWIQGLSVLAVPIWQQQPGGTRKLVATLALGAASARFDELGEKTIAGHLLEAAGAIRDRLGLRPQTSRAAQSQLRKEKKRLEETRS
jgi:DNA-binding IclR family transcriptional regulator